MIYFPTNWGAKEPQNPQNHRVVEISFWPKKGDFFFQSVLGANFE